MPELPDVEVFRKYINSHALHKNIRKARVYDEKILAGRKSSSFAGALEGHRFEQTLRHGKYCFLLLDNHKTLAMHFGMTGFVQYYKVPEKAPGHVRASFEFDNDFTLAYDSRRKLGKIELLDDIARFIDDRELGPDALDPEFSEDDFVKAVAGRKGNLKAALMNQHIIAGIGNVYSDEILFQERLHPHTAITDLDDERLRRIFKTLRRILSQVVETGAKPEEMPPSLLTHHRGRDMKCPGCQGHLEKMKAAGRSAYYCPSCQAR